ncbi:MAG: glycosylase, partial [Marivirga sp.]|nr:glycosylase [Marivirga sp.]
NNKPELIYRIRMASSTDGINWIKFDQNIIADKLGANEVQASPDVFFYGNKFHMFFCYMVTPDFRTNKAKSYRIGYASSTDLINWERNDSMAGIDVSAEGWDSEMVAYPHVFELDGNVYMFYLGNQVGRYGFGLAQLENLEQLK